MGERAELIKMIMSTKYKDDTPNERLKNLKFLNNQTTKRLYEIAETNKKDMLIDFIMSTKYADDDDQYYQSNQAHLQSQSIDELDMMAMGEDNYDENFPEDLL